MARRPVRTLGDVALVFSVWLTALIVCGSFAWILGDLITRGKPELSWEFISGSPADAGRAGGILPILVSTAAILFVCLSVCVPVSIAAAACLSDLAIENSLFARTVRRCLDVLAGVPSIVFGLFGSAFFCQFLGLGFSIWAGGLTLACMVLPILVRATEEGFRSIGDEHRVGAAALGLSPATVLFRVTLPLAAPSLVVGLVLGIGRALAETAALVFTSGYVDRMPTSLGDSGRALSIHIFELSMNVPGGDRRAAASAVVLIGAVLGMNLLASRMTKVWLRASAVGSSWDWWERLFGRRTNGTEKWKTRSI
ncbi:MAG: phosphate ABC transporter permease PstA [Myxococcota bacterium]